MTGGTLLMTPSEPGAPDAPAQSSSPTSGRKRGAVSLDEERTSRDLIAEVPSLGRIADFDTRLLFHMDSANMQPADWLTLARTVHAELPRYDGIVVVHGTDTMAYSASALALLLGPLPKPVVLTGSQKPLVEIRTDARQNLIDAAMVATLPVPEVSIVTAARALRGARATKRDAWGFAAFDSPNCAPLVQLGIGVEVAPHVLPTAELAPFDERLEPRVLAVRVFPGLDPELVRASIRSGVKGLVLEAYGTGNLPNLGGSLIPALEEARERSVPVLVVSQCLRGFVELGQYDGGAAAQGAGAISGGDMTVEAALAKMMIGLARHGTGDELRSYLTRSAVGERDA
jgi:L-asparaginase